VGGYVSTRHDEATFEQEDLGIMKWRILGALAVFTVFASAVPMARCDGTSCTFAPDVFATSGGLDQAGHDGVTITYENPTNKTTTVYSNNGGLFNWMGTQEYFFQQKSSSADTKSFISFCLEVNQTIATGPSGNFEFQKTALADAPKQSTGLGDSHVENMGNDAAQALRELWGYKMPSLSAAGFTDTIDIAAMQLAIWEIVSEPFVDGQTPPKFDLSTGRLTAGSTSSDGATVITLAKQFFDESQTYYDDHPTAPLPNLIALTNPCAQDQLVAVVPEPTSLLAWCLLGCVGLVTSRRYRRHRD